MEEMIYYTKAAACIGAAIAIAVGTVGVALGQGMVGAKACESIAKNPEAAGPIRQAMFFSLVLIEASAIYALLIAIMLIFFGGR